MTIYFLGGGNMAAAIIGGLVKQQPCPPIHVVNRGEEKRRRLAAQYGVSVSETLPTLTGDDVLVLAVKPQDMQAACVGVEPHGALVLSVAAGLTVDTLSGYLNGTRRIVRIMPNTPAQVGLGMAGLFAADGVTAADKATAEKIMRASGDVVWLSEEQQMDAFTGICGSGPAYVFYLLDALKTAAVEQGFSDDVAAKLSLATFKGAAVLAEQTGLPFAQLQQNVTSKGGTTYEAIEVFKRREVAASIREGVAACAARAAEIARQFSGK